MTSPHKRTAESLLFALAVAAGSVPFGSVLVWAWGVAGR